MEITIDEEIFLNTIYADSKPGKWIVDASKRPIILHHKNFREREQKTAWHEPFDIIVTNGEISIGSFASEEAYVKVKNKTYHGSFLYDDLDRVALVCLDTEEQLNVKTENLRRKKNEQNNKS